MTENFHIYIVVMLHLGFAIAIRLWRGNERFSDLFALAWLIEAARAAILLPEVHSIGGNFVDEWFCLADVLNTFATALLIASGAALMGRRLSGRLIAIYFCVSIPVVLAGRYFGPSFIETWFPAFKTEAKTLAVLFNLVIMFAPVTAVRTLFTFWLFQTWRRSRSEGAMIACLFGVTYSVVALAVPFQFYFDWQPSWMTYFWCVRVFGFSVGILILIISRSDQRIRESNDQLRTALEQLAIAQNKIVGQERLKALGQMAAGVAHDINNALTPMSTYLSLLESHGELPKQALEWTHLIQLGVEDASSTVRRLNHFYRKSHNRKLLDSLDLAELVQQSVELTKPKWKDQARSLRRQIEVSTLINDRPKVRGEASQLRSVLMNLIFNACDAIPEHGVIQLQVDCQKSNAIVSVTDSGTGMNQEQMERCFEPFYSSKPQGSGLGLSECYGIIRQHGGEIDVESAVGESTVIRFTLPIDDSRPFKPELNERHQGVAIPVPECQPNILCIEDDPLVARSTKELLQRLPATVETAEDGEAGIELLCTKDFDLVLCDQGLPGADGITVLGEIKSRWPDMKVIMVSGWTLPEIVQGPQPDGFIAKPCDPDVLKSTVREMLGKETRRSSV